MTPTEVTGIVCPHCSEFIERGDLAPADEKQPVALETWFQCGECGTIYEDKNDVKECCE